MWYAQGWMMGMHFAWWVFWILLVVVLVILLRRQPGAGPDRETPLQLLERRYAAGEISTEEFEERKAKLSRAQH